MTRPRMVPARDEEGETTLCANCNGSGEGMHDGATCGVCHGHGVEMEPAEREDRRDELEDR